ncbi:MAG: hypothetical protein OXB98_08370 [Bryobacterales bacterium]|nr:hypothetical protein [Bryobacterales bacterium]
MRKMKLARGKKKKQSSKVQAFGCSLVIVILLGLFIWFFTAAVSP